MLGGQLHVLGFGESRNASVSPGYMPQDVLALRSWRDGAGRGLGPSLQGTRQAAVPLDSDALKEVAKDVIFRTFGTRAREFQVDALAAAAMGKDVLVISATGSGKSTCFQCLPPMFWRLPDAPATYSIVVGPLTDLAIAQVRGWRRLHWEQRAAVSRE
jgi:hypothetical protein